MRVTSGMMQASQRQMFESETYNKYMKNHRDEEDDEKKSSEADNETMLTDNIVLVESEDSFRVEQIDASDERKILHEVDLDSDYGQELKKLTKRPETSAIENEFSKLNRSIKSMSLSDYI